MSPRPSEQPRPACRRQVAGPRGSSLPRLRHRATRVHSSLRSRPLPSPPSSTRSRRHERPPRSPTDSALPRASGTPAAPTTSSQPRATASNADGIPHAADAHKPRPRCRLPPEPEHGTCACARMRETRDAPSSTVSSKQLGACAARGPAAAVGGAANRRSGALAQ